MKMIIMIRLIMRFKFRVVSFSLFNSLLCVSSSSSESSRTMCLVLTQNSLVFISIVSLKSNV